MKNLSLKMKKSLYEETERIILKVGTNRNRYVNEAVKFYNILQKRRILTNELKKESKLVKEESMKVLAEFEGFEIKD